MRCATECSLQVLQSSEVLAQGSGQDRMATTMTTRRAPSARVHGRSESTSPLRLVQPVAEPRTSRSLGFLGSVSSFSRMLWMCTSIARSSPTGTRPQRRRSPDGEALRLAALGAQVSRTRML